MRTKSRIASLGLRPAVWLCVVAVFPTTLLAAPRDAEAVALTADRVQYWDGSGARWVLLQGQASVEPMATGRGLAGTALARIEGKNDASGRSARVELYSLDLAAAEDPLARPPILQFDARERITLKARTADGVVRLTEPPLGFRKLGGRQATTAVATQAREPEPIADRPKPDVSDPDAVPPLEGTLSSSEPAARPDIEPDSAVSDGSSIASAVSEPALSAVDPGQLAPSDYQLSRVQDPGFDANFAPGFDQDPAPILERDPSPTDPIEPGGMDDDPLPLPRGEFDDPDDLDGLEPLPRGEFDEDEEEMPDAAPLVTDSQRIWSISPRYGGRQMQMDTRAMPDGRTAYIIRGGVIIVSEVQGRGRVDLSADHVVMWTRPPEGGLDAESPTPGGGPISQDANQEFEVYLEGDVVIRNDRMKNAGNTDQTLFKANSAYYDFRTERLVALDAEINIFAPGLMSPLRTKSPLINQYREELMTADGRMVLGSPRISAEQTSTTGSRFPEPGYRFNSRSVDISVIEDTVRDPFSGGELANPRGPLTPRAQNWLVDSRQNVYYVGPVPVFWWPRIRATDDFDPPIRNVSFRYGNYFGYQVLTDWSAFKLLGIRRPNNIDTWNVDIDYLSLRGPAAGSEIGWFGRDLLGDLADPYNKRGRIDGIDQPYFGYFDVWGILDKHNDVLGPGPAIVTYGPPGAGKKGYQRTDVPSFHDQRGRFIFRHMNSLLGPDAEPDDDFRIQFEAGAYTDRQFLEQYYKRLFDSGLDQNTLAYGIYQRRNQAVTLTGQVNYMEWITDTQWLPKLEYYRIGDTLLDHMFSYSSNYGVDYANVHTAVEVNNPNLFAFLPYDPISNTSGPWSSGRGWTTQQLELPLNFDYFRIIPYGQGQLMGWTNQLNYEPTGRAWGAVGVRANMMAWKLYNSAESELFNVHGLAHKLTLDIDFRSAYSNIGLGQLGVQDNLDDDTYELVRRYFAMTNYVGGILPAQYDPRFLLLRRTLNPVVFAPDIQSSIETITLALRQRLQTKRGPEGRRRIVDYMLLDLQSTFYPNSNRDNFGTPLGQTMYNYEWYVGDRTSLVSTGWFEFWDIQGNPILVTDPRHSNDPFGLTVITAGVSVNRPPRGNVYLGYSIVNTGPIATSALNSAFNYWLSPKWYGSFAMSYDFGNAILLGTTFSLTKIGADYLTSVGLSVDPQRQNFTFGLEIAPRFSQTARLGSAVGTRFDSRFAPTQ